MCARKITSLCVQQPQFVPISLTSRHTSKHTDSIWAAYIKSSARSCLDEPKTTGTHNCIKMWHGLRLRSHDKIDPKPTYVCLGLQPQSCCASDSLIFITHERGVVTFSAASVCVSSCPVWALDFWKPWFRIRNFILSKSTSRSPYQGQCHMTLCSVWALTFECFIAGMQVQLNTI